MTVSDLHAALRDHAFGLLSPVHQLAELASAVEEESATKGASMREWSPAAQVALLKWLSYVVQENPNPSNMIELWRVRKGERELRCRAHYLAIGIDVRLFEGEEFRRTKSDAHMAFQIQSVAAFYMALQRAMKRHGDWCDETFTTALKRFTVEAELSIDEPHLERLIAVGRLRSILGSPCRTAWT